MLMTLDATVAIGLKTRGDVRVANASVAGRAFLVPYARAARTGKIILGVLTDFCAKVEGR